MGDTKPAVVPPITAKMLTGPGFENHGAPICVFIHIPRTAKIKAPTVNPTAVARITTTAVGP